MGTYLREALKWLFFGPSTFPQQCAIGLRDPQAEVRVWLQGLGPPRDVTYNHVIASAQPFAIGIGFEGKLDAAAIPRGRPSLEFREQNRNRLLGEIRLRLIDAVPLGAEQLCLFAPSNCKNHCLPKARLWARYLHYAYQDWRSKGRANSSSIRLTGREAHCLYVLYICPRPVVLVSVVDGDAGNIFPMDLIGPVGTRYFSLALHSSSAALPLVEHSRQIALSSVPLGHRSAAYLLGKYHHKSCADWNSLPFATTRSPTFGLPVPRFALRIREMRIEVVRSLGSHKLFLAKTVSDQRWGDELQLFLVHGFYQAWRRRGKHDGQFRNG